MKRLSRLYKHNFLGIKNYFDWLKYDINFEILNRRSHLLRYSHKDVTSTLSFQTVMPLKVKFMI